MKHKKLTDKQQINELKKYIKLLEHANAEQAREINLLTHIFECLLEKKEKYKIRKDLFDRLYPNQNPPANHS